MRAMNRRGFVKTMGAASVLTAASSGRVLGANERVRVGFIGVGNRGDQVLDAFLANADAQVVAVCDLYEPYRRFAAQKVGTDCQQYSDYRKVLDRKDIDAVVIAAPDHWHAIMFCEACLAGKDVYVEKPLSLRIAEGRRMVEIARKFNRVAQVGIQRRSVPSCRDACQFVREGGLGKVTVARAFHVLNEAPFGIGKFGPSDPPAGFDYDKWLGPAPKKPYADNRVFYRFRWFWDYSGGQMTNFGTHYMDLIQWALGKDSPLAVTAVGGKFGNMDNREIPDTMEVLYHYDGGTLVTFSQYNCNAALPAAKDCLVEFRGTNGTMYVTYQGIEVVPESIRTDPVPARSPLKRDDKHPLRKAMEPKQFKDAEGFKEDVAHARNFLEAVKSRQRPSCDIEIGHRATTATLLGNVALKTKSYLEWDGEKERVTNNEEANRLLAYEYREGYRLP